MKKIILFIILIIILSGCISLKATVPEGYVLIKEDEINAMALSYFIMEQQLGECIKQLESLQGEQDTF